MTFTKSQGCSIDWVTVDLGVKEYLNMTYVALTRATLRGRLIITGDFSFERFKRA